MEPGLWWSGLVDRKTLLDPVAGGDTIAAEKTTERIGMTIVTEMMTGTNTGRGTPVERSTVVLGHDPHGTAGGGPTLPITNTVAGGPTRDPGLDHPIVVIAPEAKNKMPHPLYDYPSTIIRHLWLCQLIYKHLDSNTLTL